MFVLAKKNLFLLIAACSILLAAGSLFVFGLNPGIDFQGGTVYEVSFEENRPSIGAVQNDLSAILQNQVTVQHTGEKGLLIKSASISNDQKEQINQRFAQIGEFKELRFRELSATVSKEMANKSFFAIALVIAIIVAFIAYTFSGVSKPVSSWKYGLVAVVALVHDTIIPIGIFAFLGSILVNFQIDVLFVTAILATLGYSVNDTIVVFDRVRENLAKQQKATSGEQFSEVVGISLKQTFMRSLYTSITTLTALTLLYFFGGETTQPFALTLAIGVVAGTYSSLFIACPLLVWIEERQKEKPENAELVDESSDESIPDDVKRFLAKQNKS